MDYQQYIEHLAITMPGTVPLSYELWRRTQLEKAANTSADRSLPLQQCVSDALKSCGLEIDTPANADIMRRYYEDD
jgi:hypothetical protein